MARRIVVIEVDASQSEIEAFVGKLQGIVAEFDPAALIEMLPAGASRPGDRAFLRALGDIEQIVESASAERAGYARRVQPGDLIVWWDDDLGFFEGRVRRVHQEGGRSSFEIEGSDNRVSEDDLYRPLNDHDAQLWAVLPGDDLEWYCPTAAERGAGGIATPHCPDLGASSCPGGLWHRARVEQVFHEGFEAPYFKIAGCARMLGEPSFQIRVPGVAS